MKAKILTKSKLAALLLGALLVLAAAIGLAFGGGRSVASAHPDDVGDGVGSSGDTYRVDLVGASNSRDYEAEIMIYLYDVTLSKYGGLYFSASVNIKHNGAALGKVTVYSANPQTIPSGKGGTHDHASFTFIGAYQQLFPNALRIPAGEYELTAEVASQWNNGTPRAYTTQTATLFSLPADYALVETYPLPPDPEKAGYDFAGWYYDQALTQAYDGALITADIDLYAKFTPIAYTISYLDKDGNTLTVPTGTPTTYTIESTSITLATPTAAKGYAFSGWYETVSLSGAAVTNIPTGSMGNRTYYAKFTAIIYTIAYSSTANVTRANGVTYELAFDMPADTEYTYTVEREYVFPVPTVAGYRFVKWDLVYYADRTPRISTQNPGLLAINIARLTAYFEEIEYSVSYNLNDGTLTDTPQASYTVYDSLITLPEPTRTGYAFKGWYDNADCNGAQISVIPTGSTGDKTYYAKWEILKYKVTFYVDGEVYNEMTVDYGSTLSSVYLVNPQTLEAVQLFTSADMTTAFNLDTVIAENMTIHATAGFVAYNSVTYKVNGEELATDLLDYNTPLKDLRTATLDGYTFDGWYYDTAFTRAVQPTDKLTDNITLYAKMTPIDPQAEKTWIQKWWWTFAVGGAVLVVIAIAVLVIRKKKRG